MRKRYEGLVRWGEIYLVDLGTSDNSVQAGIRPVLILQNNVGNTFSTTTLVAPITSTVKRLHLPTHVFLDPSCGLPSPSVVMLEQLRTIDKSELIKYMGKLRDAPTISDVKEAISAELGMVDPPYPYRSHLCPKCREMLKKDPRLKVYRENPQDIRKALCDVCHNGVGFVYNIRKAELKNKRKGEEI